MEKFDPKEVLFLVRLYEDRIQHLEARIGELEDRSNASSQVIEENIDELAEYHEKELEEKAKKYYDKKGNSNCI